jgi:hypothetical protein
LRTPQSSLIVDLLREHSQPLDQVEWKDRVITIDHGSDIRMVRDHFEVPKSTEGNVQPSDLKKTPRNVSHPIVGKFLGLIYLEQASQGRSVVNFGIDHFI